MNAYHGNRLLRLGCMALFTFAGQVTLGAIEPELTGTYTIPEGAYMDEPLELAAPDIEWNQGADGTISLEYDLPYEIAGPHAGPIKLHSVSAQQPLRLRGDIAEGRCRNTEKRISCTMFYQKNEEGLFPIDTEAGLAHMQSLNLDEAEIARIMEAQETLMHEAVGVLTFRLP